MSIALATTFDLLANSRNPFAEQTLIHALDVPEDGVQAAAVSALLASRSIRGCIEIVRRLKAFSPTIRAQLPAQVVPLSRVWHDCLVSHNDTLRDHALELIAETRDYSAIGILVDALDRLDPDGQRAVAGTIATLADRLFEQLQPVAPYGANRATPGVSGQTPLRDAGRVRHLTLEQLERALGAYSRHHRPEIVEALLIIGGASNSHVRRLVFENTEEVRLMATEMLRTSVRPGLMTMIADALAQNYPHPATMAAISYRSDATFARHFLTLWPRTLTPFHQKNLQDISHVAWLEPAALSTNDLPEELQNNLVAFVVASGLDDEKKLAILEWLVKFGSPSGRLAATDVLSQLENDKVQEVVLGSLSAPEPEVQAWATQQLRHWSIPNAMELLIKRLDSPLPEVQAAARAELGDFNLGRVLEIFDHLDPRVYDPVSILLRKIDTEVITRLRQELVHSIGRRRMRAARAALALNMHTEVEDALLVMAGDADSLVRRTAAETLGAISTPEAGAVLNLLAHDPSPRVREVALSALQRHASLPPARPAQAPPSNMAKNPEVHESVAATSSRIPSPELY
jgi:HEAT repeat protein